METEIKYSQPKNAFHLVQLQNLRVGLLPCPYYGMVPTMLLFGNNTIVSLFLSCVTNGQRTLEGPHKAGWSLFSSELLKIHQHARHCRKAKTAMHHLRYVPRNCFFIMPYYRGKPVLRVAKNSVFFANSRVTKATQVGKKRFYVKKCLS